MKTDKLVLITSLHVCVQSSTDLADVPTGEAHQCGEPVGDVQQSFGDPSPTLQQGAVNEGHPTDSTLPVRPLETQ